MIAWTSNQGSVFQWCARLQDEILSYFYLVNWFWSLDLGLVLLMQKVMTIIKIDIHLSPVNFAAGVCFQKVELRILELILNYLFLSEISVYHYHLKKQDYLLVKKTIKQISSSLTLNLNENNSNLFFPLSSIFLYM